MALVDWDAALYAISPATTADVKATRVKDFFEITFSTFFLRFFSCCGLYKLFTDAVFDLRQVWRAFRIAPPFDDKGYQAPIFMYLQRSATKPIKD